MWRTSIARAGSGGAVVSPHEMRPAMQAQGVEVHDAADASQREPLVMCAPRVVRALGGPRGRRQRPAHGDGGGREDDDREQDPKGRRADAA